MNVLLVGQNKACLSKIVDILSTDQQMHCTEADSIDSALETIALTDVSLVILEEQIEGFSGYQFAERLIEKNPMLYLAFISDLSHDEFHEATEGLGAIGSIPSSPSKEDVELIISQINKIQSML